MIGTLALRAAVRRRSIDEVQVDAAGLERRDSGEERVK